MAAYEVLLLNTAIPQIQAAQSGDTYVVPRDIAFSTVASFAAGTAALPSIVATGDTNTGIWFPAADTFAISTAGAEAVRINSSGNLGLGVTPSAWGLSGAKTLQINNAAFWGYLNNAYVSANNYNDGTGNKYIATGFATRYAQATGQHIWETAASGTAGNAITFTQAMTLDASGNLLVGTTSNTYSARLVAIGSGNGLFELGQATSSTLFQSNGQDFYLNLKGTGNIVFRNGASDTERARITSGGYFKASDDGTYANSTGSFHELTTNDANNAAAVITNRSASPGTYSIVESIEYTAAAPNNSTAILLLCKDNAANRLELRSNGGLANYQANDVNLSDQRTKKDIVAAPSYWDKIKGIEIVHFKYKDQTHDDNNVGVIAQQVEQVAPEFVDQDGWGETPEDGVPLKSIYTSDMYHAAIKALQEAMARIEQLEAKVAAMGA